MCLVLLHGFGLHWVLLFHMSSEKRLLKVRPHMVTAVVLFGTAIFLMLSLHLAEVIAWAVALVSLVLIERAHDAAYFCANAYTTLGYGNVDLAMPWRNISPIIGISGLFTFAWTTSSLVNMVAGHNRLLAQLHEEREKQKGLRRQLRKSIGEAQKRESEVEHAERIAAKEKMEGSGLRSRWGM